jgi:hypothetical protein
VYFAFPYDLEAAKTWSVGWVARRTALNLALMFGCEPPPSQHLRYRVYD